MRKYILLGIILLSISINAFSKGFEMQMLFINSLANQLFLIDVRDNIITNHIKIIDLSTRKDELILHSGFVSKDTVYFLSRRNVYDTQVFQLIFYEINYQIHRSIYTYTSNWDGIRLVAVSENALFYRSYMIRNIIYKFDFTTQLSKKFLSFDNDEIVLSLRSIGVDRVLVNTRRNNTDYFYVFDVNSKLLLANGSGNSYGNSEKTRFSIVKKDNRIYLYADYILSLKEIHAVVRSGYNFYSAVCLSDEYFLLVFSKSRPNLIANFLFGSSQDHKIYQYQYLRVNIPKDIASDLTYTNLKHSNFSANKKLTDAVYK